MNDLIQLSEICDALGMQERVAKAKASKQLLPFPAFRISGTRKGPWYVRKDDLEHYIDEQASKAIRLHSQMRSASGV